MLIITAGLRQGSGEVVIDAVVDEEVVVDDAVVDLALEMAGEDGVAMDTRAHDRSIKNIVSGVTLVDIKLLKQCIVH